MNRPKRDDLVDGAFKLNNTIKRRQLDRYIQPGGKILDLCTGKVRALREPTPWSLVTL